MVNILCMILVIVLLNTRSSNKIKWFLLLLLFIFNTYYSIVGMIIYLLIKILRK